MGWDLDVDGIETTASQIETRAENIKDVKYVVGTDVEYAVYLEFGTSEMPPYPFARPAVEDVMTEQADQIVDEAETVQEAVRDIAFAIERRMTYYTSEGPPGPGVVTGNLKDSIRAERIG